MTHAPHRGDREVRARDLLLQRRRRDAVSAGGAPARAEPEGGHVRPDARDERAGRDRRAVRRDRGAASTTSSSATTPTATWWGTPGSMPATIEAVETVDACLARVLAARRARGRALARHRRPRQLRDDDRSRQPAVRTPRTRPTRCRSSSSTDGPRPLRGPAARCATSARRCSRCSGSSNRRR